MDLDSGIDQPAGPDEEGAEYTAPKIESVITRDDLAREVHYAGVVDGSGAGLP
ncbi:MAG: hypothetical protein ACSLFK_10965 [Gemmatimonadaceae bacterium]